MQGTYLTSAALSHARDNNLPEGPTLGSFNGEFLGVFACTQVQLGKSYFPPKNARRTLPFVLHTSSVASIASYTDTDPVQWSLT
jgi:hypothetical protein